MTTLAAHKTIPLSQGKVALVDASDYERVSQYKWSRDQNGYPVRKITVHRDGVKRQRKIMLHRYILSAPAGMDVDHINHDLLDNRRANLRLATRSQNNANSPGRSGSSSRYKGVWWHVRDRKWNASICVDGEKRSLGSYDDEADAARAYDRAAYAAWGEYAYLNFPDELEPQT